MSTPKLPKAEITRAMETLRNYLPPGSTVHCVLRHVSRSGMMRRIDFYKIDGHDTQYLTGWMNVVLDERHLPQEGGMRVFGCGMDMGFAMVYEISHALYPSGFGCIGQNRETRIYCPSSDHSNGDRNWTPHGQCILCKETSCQQDKPHLMAKHWHSDGGYALRHAWL